MRGRKWIACSDEPTPPVKAMLSGVQIELGAAKGNAARSAVDVTDGVRQGLVEAGATYRFTCTRADALRSDEYVMCTFPGTKVEGSVVDTEPGAITLWLKADLGPTIRGGTVLVDKAFLWAALRDRLNELLGHPERFNVRSIEALTGRHTPATFPGPALPPSATGGLNAEQREAVRRAARADVSWVWGPPGTGKTTVCARISADVYYARGLSALLTAPTNKAVDVSLARTLDRLASRGLLEKALDSGGVIRVGVFSDPDLERRYGARVRLDALVNARKRALVDDLERMRREREDDEDELRALAAADDRAHDEDVRARREALIESLECLASSMAHVTSEMGRERETILAKASLVAATTCRAYLPGQLERRFDAVLIDEAGFTNLPAACAAAMLARSHVVLLGDFRQLGPVVESRHPHVLRWVARDPFTAAGIVDALAGPTRPAGLTALRHQHRCRPGIAALLNDVTYREFPLVTAPSVIARPTCPSPWPAEVVLLDTSPLRSFVYRTASKSRGNPLHVATVRWLALALATLPGRGADSIAVLTPFREQMRRVRDALPPSLASTCEVSTVHRYQGDERDFVILDLVEARGLRGISPLLAGRALTDSGGRLCNVAASRAREQLIVCADVKFLLQHAPRRGPVWKFVSYLSRNALRIQLPPQHVQRALDFIAAWEQRAA